MRCIIADNDLTDFNGFLTIMAKRMSAPEPDDQLLEAFRIFDKEGKVHTMGRAPISIVFPLDLFVHIRRKFKPSAFHMTSNNKANDIKNNIKLNKESINFAEL